MELTYFLPYSRSETDLSFCERSYPLVNLLVKTESHNMVHLYVRSYYFLIILLFTVVSSRTVACSCTAWKLDWLQLFLFDRVTVIGAGLFKLFIVFAVVPRILIAFVICKPVASFVQLFMWCSRFYRRCACLYYLLSRYIFLSEKTICSRQYVYQHNW